MAEIGNLLVNIGINVESLVDGLKRAKKSITGFAGDAQAKFKSMAASVKGALSTMTAKILALAGIGGFGLLLKSTKDNIVGLQGMSDVIGVSVEALQDLTFATQKYTNAGPKTLATALTKATARLAEYNATGGGAAATWLEKMALDTRELAKLKPDELFKKYSEEIGKLSTRGEQLAAIAGLMDDEARALIGVMDQGAEGMAAASAEAEKLGLSLSRVDTEAVVRANAALVESGKVIKGMANAIWAELSPAFIALTKMFKNASIENDNFRNVVADGIEATIRGVGYLMQAWDGLKLTYLFLKKAFTEYYIFIIGKLVDMDKALVELVNKTKIVTLEYSSALNEINTSLKNVAGDIQKEIDEILKPGEPAGEQLVKDFRKAVSEVEAELEKTAAVVRKKKEDLAKPATIEFKIKVIKPDEEVPVFGEFGEDVGKFFTDKEQLDQEKKAFEERIEMVTKYANMVTNMASTVTNAWQQLTQNNLSQATQEHQLLEQLAADAERSGARNAAQLRKQADEAAKAAEKAFKQNQLAQIANTVVNTASAMIRAFADLPFPAAVVASGLIAAAGAVQIGIIRSQKYNAPGSSVSKPSISTPSLAPTTNLNASANDGGGGEQDQGRGVTHITIVGRPSRLTDEDYDQIFAEIEQRSEHDRIIFNTVDGTRVNAKVAI